MAIAETVIPQTDEHIYYPSGDDEPMAETQIHVNAIIQLREFMDDLLAGRADAWIGTDQFWYWEKGRPKSRCAPDIMVVFGVPKEPPRRSFFTWREGGRVPSFICEFSSEHTWENDLEEKFQIFQRLGVEEYFLFDPEDLYLEPALQGYRLQAGRYQPIPLEADGSLESKTLGVKLIAEGGFVRLLDLKTGAKILSRVERLKESEKRAAEKDVEIARLKALLEEVSRSKIGPVKP